ncbi:THUMP-like domain-containing protein [Aquimarina algicola]|uniref:Class I SAM-dependent methyltransferase n=1 Tax=Aquimarina algicola TaxID=2589995 RepID=A0A504JRE4_9FLAO|nr:class I SAM-dependent methyltransferase [Aquimarina algicola]TPN89311.1 class I SAM-dependent methyltransferase [Aquimarina algicola]
MNQNILHTNIQKYIIDQSNSSEEISNIVLKGSPFDNISIQELAQQIQSRRKIRDKLPTWYAKENIYYPPLLNLEQTSSELTALYKSNIVSGKSLIDLTGGFGIDDYFFAKKMENVIHCEINKELSDIAQHNFTALQQNNIKTYADNGLEVLNDFDYIDWIYVDPSRRHESKGKVFFLEDSIPNIPENLDFLFSKSDQILIKTSPLLDIRSGIRSLQYVKEIHVLAIKNEVKELLWILNKREHQNVKIITINIQKSKQQQFAFWLEDETKQQVKLSPPQQFLYEPNAAILKSGGFLSIAKILNLNKLHLHSHLYTSDTIIDFPGRCFEIKAIYPYQKKALTKIGIDKANITTRNFPESVATLRKKLKIKDGGDTFLFFTTDNKNNKVMLLCNKIN